MFKRKKERRKRRRRHLKGQKDEPYEIRMRQVWPYQAVSCNLPHIGSKKRIQTALILKGQGVIHNTS